LRDRPRDSDEICAAAEREGNYLKGFKELGLKNGSSKGQKQALSTRFVPNSLKSGAGISVRLRVRAGLGL
jgi:hypothetical protein